MKKYEVFVIKVNKIKLYAWGATKEEATKRISDLLNRVKDNDDVINRIFKSDAKFIYKAIKFKD